MFDALTIAAIVDELNQELAEGRIQRVQHLDQLTLGFEVYARHRRQWLVASANSQQPRVLLLDKRGGGDTEIVSPLLLLLRKYARGARIISISNPRHERLIELAIAIPDPDAPIPDEDDAEIELPELVHHTLVIELMGRHSNIVMVDEAGQIRDAIKRVTPQMSRVRSILPHQPYAPPPPQDKIDPLDAAPADFAQADTSKLLWRALIGLYLSMSPILAREACYRAELDAKAKPSELDQDDRSQLASAIRQIFDAYETADWQPRAYDVADGGAEFSAIPLQHLEAREDVETLYPSSVLDAAAHAWEQGPVSQSSSDRHAARRARLLTDIDRVRERLDNRLHSLKTQQEAAANPDILREAGELIYAYQWLIEPGAETLETPEGRTIKLDPTLSISDNAQRYFDRYHKAKSAAETIPERIREVEATLDYVDQIQTLAEFAEAFDQIEGLRSEWEEFVEETPGLGKRGGGRRRPKGSKRPTHYTTDDGHDIYIGRSGRQNDELTFQIANPDDLWLHARDLPGAHVILRLNSDAGRDPAIEQAAKLAAYYSKGRGSTRVPVDVTERRHVRKIKGAGLGMVTYRNEYTLNVEPSSESELKLTSTASSS